MRIRDYVVLTGMLMLVAEPQYVSAQPGGGSETAPVAKPDRGVEGKDLVTKHLEGMTRRLSLTTEQQEAIKPILIDEEAGLDRLRADGNLTKTEQKTKMQELRDATNEKIRPILTAEQQKTRDAILKDITERHKNRKHKDPAIIPAK
jgi:hypothetical protein